MPNLTPPPLVLASSSAYRRELLARLSVPFSWQAPNIDEAPLADEPIPELCTRLAMEKARALAHQYPQHILIGCDQSAALNDHQLEKPGDFGAAFEQLAMLSGQEVTFYTSVALLNTATTQASAEIDATRVKVRRLHDDEITRYLEIDQPYDCAGSFKVESLGISLFDQVVSEDPTALMGLPMIKLCRQLRAMGYSIP